MAIIDKIISQDNSDEIVFQHNPPYKVTQRQLVHAQPRYGSGDSREAIAGYSFQRHQAGIIAVGGVAEEACRMEQGAVLVNPFLNPRTLLADFSAAQRLMTYFFAMIGAVGIFRPKPIVVFQPLEKLEGGLTQIEKRAFHELFLGAGARKFIGWTGRELTDEEIRTQSFVQESEAF